MIRRDTTADQLAKVIQVLQLGRKTGILTVERGEGETFEEGMLVLANGVVMEAKVGFRGGIDAFNLLRTWRQCKFAFIPQQPEQHTKPVLPPPSETEEPGWTFSDTPGPGELPVPKKRWDSGVLPIAPTVIPRQKLFTDQGLQRIGAANLSRAHKHVFLLVNGQRTLVELAHLTRRHIREVTAILGDLEEIGVIQR